MKILVTGFEPFGGAVINPAYEAVKLLPDVITNDIADFCVLHGTAQSYQMIETLVSISMLRTLPSR